MKQDVSLDPLNTALLGSDAVAAHAQRIAHPIQPAGPGHSATSPKSSLKFRFGYDIANHLLDSHGPIFL